MTNYCKILLLVLLGWSMGPRFAQSAEMTPQEALDIVNQRERTLYDRYFPWSEVTVHAYDVPDNECSKHLGPESHELTKSAIDQMVRTLKGRRYFLILYVPAPPEAGGPVFGGQPVCFFVDRDTRMIISIDW